MLQPWQAIAQRICSIRILEDKNLKIVEVKDRTTLLIEQLLKVWENSVKATHLFLSQNEMENIKEYVPQALKEISFLIIAENESQIPVGFMGIAEQHLEMLFISHEESGERIR